MSIPPQIEQLAHVLTQIEGPYKWYVLGGIAFGITAIVTHFIFRTLKWVLLIAALGFILFYLWSRLFGQLDTSWTTAVHNREQIQTSLQPQN